MYKANAIYFTLHGVVTPPRMFIRINKLWNTLITLFGLEITKDSKEATEVDVYIPLSILRDIFKMSKTRYKIWTIPNSTTFDIVFFYNGWTQSRCFIIWRKD